MMHLWSLEGALLSLNRNCEADHNVTCQRVPPYERRSQLQNAVIRMRHTYLSLRGFAGSLFAC